MVTVTWFCLYRSLIGVLVCFGSEASVGYLASVVVVVYRLVVVVLCVRLTVV